VDAREDTPEETESGLSYLTKLEPPPPVRNPPSSSESSPPPPDFPFFFSRRFSGSVQNQRFLSRFSFCSSVRGSSSASEALTLAALPSSFSCRLADLSDFHSLEGLLERRLARPKLNGERAFGSLDLGLASVVSVAREPVLVVAGWRRPRMSVAVGVEWAAGGVAMAPVAGVGFRTRPGSVELPAEVGVAGDRA